MGINFVIYLAIGITIGIIFYFLLRKVFLGRIYGSVIAGIIGSILGGYISSILGNPLQNVSIYIFGDFFYKSFNIEPISTILGSMLLVTIFSFVSSSISKKF